MIVDCYVRTGEVEVVVMRDRRYRAPDQWQFLEVHVSCFSNLIIKSNNLARLNFVNDPPPLLQHNYTRLKRIFHMWKLS